MDRTGGMPSMVHASVYSAVTQYLKAIDAAGGDGTEAVAAKLKEMPVDDVFGRGAKVAANGRLMNTQYLMQVKTPDESRYDWDYYKIVAEIPGEQAYLDPAQSGCPLVQ